MYNQFHFLHSELTSATASVKVKWHGIYQYLTAVRSEVLSPKKRKKTPSQSIILQIAYSYIYVMQRCLVS